jgi:hypothetical protein
MVGAQHCSLVSTITLKHSIYHRFRSPYPLKKGAKILFPPFLRGDEGGIENLDGTLKNPQMLVNNDFLLMLARMSNAVPLQTRCIAIN